VRPTALESLRAIQAALAEMIIPELASAFAQDAAQTVQLLLESLAAEWDTAVHDLHQDNAALGSLLSSAREAVASLPEHNILPAAVVSEIDRALAEGAPASLAYSAQYERNVRLRGLLEEVLVAFEGVVGEQGLDAVVAVRADIYCYLRQVALRGWSFFDVSSFRERVVAARRGDAPSGLG
jgi:hypothetical protein